MAAFWNICLIKKLIQNHDHLQDKVAHFARTDRAQYAQLFDMRQGEAARLVTSLLRADKVLHEQQLGWAWHPPSADLFQPPGEAPAEAEEGECPEEASGEREGSWLEAVGEEYRPLLRLLCDEAGYLIPGKVEEVVRGKPSDGRRLSDAHLFGQLGRRLCGGRLGCLFQANLTEARDSVSASWKTVALS